MPLDVSVVVGNPKVNSRTRTVAETFVEMLLEPESYRTDVIELGGYAAEMAQWPAERVDRLNAQVAQSDLVVFASPTYKATYTGLLKLFLDRYDTDGLDGVTAIPLHTGGGPTHAMGPTFTLAPLLMELGATVPGRGLYVPMSELATLEDYLRGPVEQYARNISRMSALAAAVQQPRAEGTE